MAYRCLEKIKIDGQIVNLMQINNVASAVSAGSGWAVNISNSYVASQGDNFLDIFNVGWITDNTVYTKYVDGSNAVLTNYAQSQSGDLYNWVTFDVSNLTTTRAETGYLNPSSQYGADHIYWGIAIDDDIQEGVLFTGIAKGTATGNLYMYNNDSNKRKDIYNAFKTPKQGGGAGSGYIGNSLLSNKKMVGYNVPTSSAEATKTESINEVSANPVSNKPKLGNGFVKIKFLRESDFKIYGFHINGNTSDPSQKVTYLADAIGMTPAHMDFENDRFDYGSWEDAFFMPKPVIIKPGGSNYEKEILSYLDPNYYSKDINGNSVNITSLGKNTNVMIQFPKIWVKVVADTNDAYSGSVYISNTKVDDDYFDFAYIDKSYTHRDYTYLAAYMGSVKDSSTIGSVSGAHLTPDNSNWNGANQFTKARNAGQGYDMEMLCQVQLVTYLLILIGKSTNTRSVFGNGIQVGSDTAIDNFITGVHDNKGLFYGSNQDNVAVKVFGIENWWGLAYRRYAGDIVNNLAQRVKLCYGTSDGSSTSDYIESNYNGSSYWSTGITLSGTAYKTITKLKFINGKGIFPCEASGDSANSDYCDFMYFNSSWNGTKSAHGMHGGQGSTTGALARYYGEYPQWYWQQFNASLGMI